MLTCFCRRRRLHLPVPAAQTRSLLRTTACPSRPTNPKLMSQAGEVQATRSQRKLQAVPRSRTWTRTTCQQSRPSTSRSPVTNLHLLYSQRSMKTATKPSSATTRRRLGSPSKTHSYMSLIDLELIKRCKIIITLFVLKKFVKSVKTLKYE